MLYGTPEMNLLLFPSLSFTLSIYPFPPFLSFFPLLKREYEQTNQI